MNKIVFWIYVRIIDTLKMISHSCCICISDVRMFEKTIIMFTLKFWMILRKSCIFSKMCSSSRVLMRFISLMMLLLLMQESCIRDFFSSDQKWCVIMQRMNNKLVLIFIKNKFKIRKELLKWWEKNLNIQNNHKKCNLKH